MCRLDEGVQVFCPLRNATVASATAIDSGQGEADAEERRSQTLARPFARGEPYSGCVPTTADPSDLHDRQQGELSDQR
jgi:hypothetical protein